MVFRRYRPDLSQLTLLRIQRETNTNGSGRGDMLEVSVSTTAQSAVGTGATVYIDTRWKCGELTLHFDQSDEG